ncbi:MAG: ComEC/Rec2 family competence protein [Bacillota bacterium]|nr:ComEC/Rec2 family competence protein [Bacillota bacterium]
MVRKKRDFKNILGILLALAILLFYYFSNPSDTHDSGQGGNIPTFSEENFSAVQGDLVVSFIDVGQGDSILVEQGSSTMLIDCGTAQSAEQIIEFLESRSVQSLDHLVLTHPHEDHIGGAVAVVERFPVVQVHMPNKPHTTATYGNTLETLAAQNIAISAAQAGGSFQLGEALVEILGPVEIYSDLNNCSVVLRLSYGENSFLFTGDAEIQAEEDILRKRGKLKADLLKVSHHGSNTSSSQAFLDTVLPRIAVISCSADNEYGHPHPETIKKLQDMGTSIFRTDLQGTILAVSDGKEIKIFTGDSL